MPKNARDVAAGLRKKGFVERANRHKRYVLWVKEKKTAIFTEISHGEKEIGDPLLGVMARQLKISRSQFLDPSSTVGDGETALAPSRTRFLGCFLKSVVPQNDFLCGICFELTGRRAMICRG